MTTRKLAGWLRNAAAVRHPAVVRGSLAVGLPLWLAVETWLRPWSWPFLILAIPTFFAVTEAVRTAGMRSFAPRPVEDPAADRLAHAGGLRKARG